MRPWHKLYWILPRRTKQATQRVGYCAFLFLLRRQVRAPLNRCRAVDVCTCLMLACAVAAVMTLGRSIVTLDPLATTPTLGTSVTLFPSAAFAFTGTVSRVRVTLSSPDASSNPSAPLDEFLSAPGASGVTAYVQDAATRTGDLRIEAVGMTAATVVSTLQALRYTLQRAPATSGNRDVIVSVEDDVGSVAQQRVAVYVTPFNCAYAPCMGKARALRPCAHLPERLRLTCTCRRTQFKWYGGSGVQ